MTRKREFRPDRTAAIAVAQQLTSRNTCEGCASLQQWPRPQCKGEASPHYRMVRDTHQERCTAYAVRATQAIVTPDQTPPASRFAVAGEVVNRKKGAGA